MSLSLTPPHAAIALPRTISPLPSSVYASLDLLTLLVRFRYSRSKLPGASLASSLAPLSDFNVVRLRASNQKHERYFCTWSPLFSFSLPPSFFLSCHQRSFASYHQSFYRSIRYPTDISAFRVLVESGVSTLESHVHMYTCALAYKLLFSENEERG